MLTLGVLAGEPCVFRIPAGQRDADVFVREESVDLMRDEARTHGWTFERPKAGIVSLMGVSPSQIISAEGAQLAFPGGVVGCHDVVWNGPSDQLRWTAMADHVPKRRQNVAQNV